MSTAVPEITIVQLANAAAASRALHVIAELGIADELGADEELQVTALAERCSCHPDALHRVLQLLELHGAFTSEQDCWSHTPSSLLLRSDHPRSLRPYARMIGQPQSWDAITQLASCVRDGRPAPVVQEAGGGFAYLQQHPDELAIFDQAMTAKSHRDIADILDTVDFGPYRSVLDVGGGRGHLLRAVLARYPHLHGVLFELPHVAEHVAADDRLHVVAGDFFVDELPPADLTLLMHVIHDWDDERAAHILQAVRRASRPGATLLLFEWIIAEHPTDDAANVLDVLMLAITGGRERTATQYTNLLEHAGYDLTAIHPTNSPLSIIESQRTAD